jgi:hypothetical protein
MDDDRRSNVAGQDSGGEAAPESDARERSGHERDLAAKSLRARDTENVPERMRPEPGVEDGGDRRNGE